MPTIELLSFLPPTKTHSSTGVPQVTAMDLDVWPEFDTTNVRRSTMARKVFEILPYPMRRKLRNEISDDPCKRTVCKITP